MNEMKWKSVLYLRLKFPRVKVIRKLCLIDFALFYVRIDISCEVDSNSVYFASSLHIPDILLESFSFASIDQLVIHLPSLVFSLQR